MSEEDKDKIQDSLWKQLKAAPEDVQMAILQQLFEERTEQFKKAYAQIRGLK